MYTKEIRVDNGWGYTCKTVNYDRKLKYCPYGSAGVNIGYKHLYLISYETCAASLDDDGWLECSCIYRQTTANHIRAFLKEYAPNISYLDMKAAFNGNYAINIHTGATRPLP